MTSPAGSPVEGSGDDGDIPYQNPRGDKLVRMSFYNTVYVCDDVELLDWRQVVYRIPSEDDDWCRRCCIRIPYSSQAMSMSMSGWDLAIRYIS